MHGDSFDLPHPDEGSFVKADWALRTAILLFALGLARALFTRVGTSLGSIALVEYNVPHESILLGEKIGAGLILFAAVTVFFRPTIIALLFIAALVFTEACAGVRAAGFAFSDLAPYSAALRYVTPLALIPLVLRKGPGNALVSSWLLRLGLATVFIIHGYEAWKLHPRFIDFIIGTASKMMEMDISESSASMMLKTIAVIDFIVAGMVLFSTAPWILGWLCFWGLVTALSRPLSLGFNSYPEVLLRASHFIAPLAVWWLSAPRRKQKEVPPWRV